MGSARNFTSAGNDFLVSIATKTPPTLRSISMWVNVTAYGLADGRAHEWRDAGGANESVQLYHPAAADILEYSTSWSLTGGVWTCPGPAIAGWHHILITFDGSNPANTPVMYLDGISQVVTLSGSAPTGTINQINASITLGQRFGGSGNKYNGSLASVALWSVLLTQANATRLAAGDAPGSIRPYPTWIVPMDQGTSPEPDLVTMNHCTVTGTTVVTGPSAVINPRFDYLETRNRLRRPGKLQPLQRRRRRVSVETMAGPVFRKTLSPIGTRTGSRQAHNAD